MAKNFMEMGAEAPRNRTIIIDALNLGFRWKHQGRTDFAEDYMKTVESFANSYNCGSIVIAADKGSSSYRKDIYPEYKADREERYKGSCRCFDRYTLRYLWSRSCIWH